MQLGWCQLPEIREVIDFTDSYSRLEWEYAVSLPARSLCLSLLGCSGAMRVLVGMSIAEIRAKH